MTVCQVSATGCRLRSERRPGDDGQMEPGEQGVGLEEAA